MRTETCAVCQLGEAREDLAFSRLTDLFHAGWYPFRFWRCVRCLEEYTDAFQWAANQASAALAKHRSVTRRETP